MAETLTIRTASSTEVIKVAVEGPQGPAGPKGDPGDVAGLPLTTQGDTLYRGASENQRLPIGTSGQILKVSAGGIPEWGAAPAGVSSWNDLTDKPSEFEPEAHTHELSDITDAGTAAASDATDFAAATHATAHAAGGSDELFDQDLNTTDDVEFNQVTFNGLVATSGIAGSSFPLNGEIRVADTGTNNYADFLASDKLTDNRTYSLPDSNGTLIVSSSAPDDGDTLVWDEDASAWITAAPSGGVTSYNDLDDLPALGTAAAKDAPASGNATSSQVVLGDDTRLTDSRTPSSTLAHKSSHAVGGTDALSPADIGADPAGTAASAVSTHAGKTDGSAHSISGISGLQSALDGKQASGSYAAASHTHAASDVTGGTLSIDRIPTGTSSTTVSLGSHTHSQLHDRSHAMTGTSDHTAGNWKLFYSNGSGEVSELALGSTAGHVLQTNGASSAPSFAALAASGATNLWLAASMWIPRTTTGCGVNSLEAATNKVNYDVLEFDTATQEYAQIAVVMPNNWNAGTVTAKFHWTAASGSGGVVWQISGRAYGDNGQIDQATGTAQTVADTLQTAAYNHITAATSAITLAGSPAAGHLVIFELSRKVSDVSDDLGVDARFIGAEISFN